MNTPAPQSVSAVRGRQYRVLATLLALCTTQGTHCVDIAGGASELSWELRTFEGERVSCADAKVSQIRLCWSALDEEATGCRRFRSFSCKDLTGVTLFEIEPGPTKLYVEPICVDGQAASSGTFQGPSEIVRTVREGEVVTLGALLIAVTDPDSCGSQCTCVR